MGLRSDQKTQLTPSMMGVVESLDVVERCSGKRLKNILDPFPASYRSSSAYGALNQSYAQRRVAREDVRYVGGILLVDVVHDESQRLAGEREGGLGGSDAGDEGEGLEGQEKGDMLEAVGLSSYVLGFADRDATRDKRTWTMSRLNSSMTFGFRPPETML